MFEIITRKYFIFVQLIFAALLYATVGLFPCGGDSFAFIVALICTLTCIYIFQIIGCYRTWKSQSPIQWKKIYILSSEALYISGGITGGISYFLQQIESLEPYSEFLFLATLGLFGVSIILILGSYLIQLDFDENIQLYYRKFYSQIVLIILPVIPLMMLLGPGCSG